MGNMSTTSIPAAHMADVANALNNWTLCGKKEEPSHQQLGYTGEKAQSVKSGVLSKSFHQNCDEINAIIHSLNVLLKILNKSNCLNFARLDSSQFLGFHDLVLSPSRPVHAERPRVCTLPNTGYFSSLSRCSTSIRKVCVFCCTIFLCRARIILKCGQIWPSRIVGAWICE